MSSGIEKHLVTNKIELITEDTFGLRIKKKMIYIVKISIIERQYFYEGNYCTTDASKI